MRHFTKNRVAEAKKTTPFSVVMAVHPIDFSVAEAKKTTPFSVVMAVHPIDPPPLHLFCSCFVLSCPVADAAAADADDDDDDHYVEKTNDGEKIGRERGRIDEGPRGWF
jgi:hypothetical protein